MRLNNRHSNAQQTLFWAVAMGALAMGMVGGLQVGKAAAPSAVSVFADGKPGIYLDTSSADLPKIKARSPYTKFMGDAPADLARCFKLLTGVDLPTEPGEGRIPLRLRLLDREEDARGPDPLGHQGYLLEISDREIVLAAPRQMGVFNAIYHVLDQWGCRWIMPGDEGEVIPRKDRLQLPTGTFRKNKRMDTRCVANATEDYGWWRARNGCGTAEWLPASHYWPTMVPAKEYFKDHPDYFAMVNGKRVPPQLETANPRLVALLIEKAKEWFRTPDIAAVSMEFCDDLDYSTSPESLALDPPNNPSFGGIPSMSDRLVILANQVGEGIEKDFPDRVVSILGYTHHTLPPVKARPRSNVAVSLTRSFGCIVHLMPRAKDPKSLLFWNNLEGWRKICSQMYTYDWVPIYWAGGLPCPLILEYPRALKKAFALGVKGNYSEKPSRCDASDFVGDYLEWRIKADPSRDPEAELKELCTVFFGPAGPAMNRYYLALTKATDTNFPEGCFDTGTALVYVDLYTPGILAEAKKALDAATAAVATHAVYASRVKMVGMTFDYLDAFLNGAWEAQKGNYDLSVASFRLATRKVTELHDMKPCYMDMGYALAKLKFARDRTLARFFPDRFGYVRSWRILGPLDNTCRDADLEEEMFPKKLFSGGVQAGQTATLADGKSLRWEPYTSPEGLVEFTAALAKTPRKWTFSSAYAATWVETPTAQEVQFRMNSFFPYRVFVNGREVFHGSGFNIGLPDQSTVTVSLPAGRSEIVIRSSQSALSSSIWSWGFYFRMTTPSGEPVSNIKIESQNTKSTS
jgi:hypothetical protein